ncbi:hypothetical protein MCOR07_001226 [Pyricularia oryzae]|nr:hypothetical protein MCOR30_004035 [Pyricularia oryzae]KAI6371378.1 hypothetical protein MCOR31_004150 [Pyricularia oryzae]KAI6398310.1 hypothetical protein MCOR23_005760 [Pyricularia oryzae]KAI6434073.1 hypothetical protein MCOR21_002529 [Pyricularia oryzae]KAI6628764.1 hypothetical protein MCOR07_001226 [Pyricularia oryzae]
MARLNVGWRRSHCQQITIVLGSSDENGESRMLRLTTECTGFERICICSHSVDAGQAVSTRAWDFSELLGGCSRGQGQMRVGGSWGVSCMYGLFNRRTRQVAYGLWNTLREPSIERGSPSTHDFFSVFNRPDKGMGRGTYPAGV